jgi:outer membrane protein assembly factor BamE (lipoprotein component of BamABCDE complex)
MKKDVLVFIALSIAILGISGCSVKMGNESLENKKATDIKQLLIKGKTTKEEVKKILGEPMSTSILANGEEMWTYMTGKASPDASSYVPVVNWFHSGSHSKVRFLYVKFDKNGIVKDYTFSSTNQHVQVGI